MCVEQKVLSPALARILDVLQPWLSQDRNSTARVTPSVSVLFPKSHLLFFPPSLPRTSPPPPLLFPAARGLVFPPRGKCPSPMAEEIAVLVLAWESVAQIPQVINLYNTRF